MVVCVSTCFWLTQKVPPHPYKTDTRNKEEITGEAHRVHAIYMFVTELINCETIILKLAPNTRNKYWSSNVPLPNKGVIQVT